MTNIHEHKQTSFGWSDETTGVEYRQLVKCDQVVSGYTSDTGRYIPSEYAVQITTESRGHGDFVAVCDLDGDRISVNNVSWELVDDDLAPAPVIDAFYNWTCD